MKDLVSLSTIQNKKVKNNLDENLGEIKDFAINSETGEVLYTVLSFGGFMGIGDKLFAVPYRALSYDHEEEHFLLNVSKEKLESAPGFDKDNWPNHANLDFLNTIYDYYGYKKPWSTKGSSVRRF